ncbi:MAG TPA: hypothetical protein PKD79_01750 [Candidatus Doudnabacteria bacterium]|nr:hypothetical protein [Candidatus Doudnabacteria bacterium]
MKKDTLTTISITSFFWIVVAIGLYPKIGHFFSTSSPHLQLIELSKEEVEFYKSKIVTVTGGKYIGSGCEIEPGYYLTALHIISHAILDGDPIQVNGVPAQVVIKGRTEEDYAILTTDETPDLAKAITPVYEFSEGEHFIVTGNPGEQVKRVQSGKITNIKVLSYDRQHIKPSARKVFAEYIEKGISGGCVYPKGWVAPVGVATMSENDNEKKRGEISLTRKRID